MLLEGRNALILKTRNHGNIVVGTDLNANGGNSVNADDPWGNGMVAYTGGIGKAGGHEGGRRNADGFGPGKGKGKASSNDGGGGGYGSAGDGTDTSSYGVSYGDQSLSHLHGGSGGGGGTESETPGLVWTSWPV